MSKQIIKELSNQELKEIYIKCKEGIEQLLLDTYNNIFNSNDVYLHGWMVDEILKFITPEMAERFSKE